MFTQYSYVFQLNKSDKINTFLQNSSYFLNSIFSHMCHSSFCDSYKQTYYFSCSCKTVSFCSKYSVNRHLFSKTVLLYILTYKCIEFGSLTLDISCIVSKFLVFKCQICFDWQNKTLLCTICLQDIWIMLATVVIAYCGWLVGKNMAYFSLFCNRNQSISLTPTLASSFIAFYKTRFILLMIYNAFVDLW